MFDRARNVTLTFAIALTGGGVYHVFALPLPWLLGPISGCLIAAALGVRLQGITSVNQTMRTILGVAVGATITPTVLVGFPAMWPTLATVPVTLILIGLIGVPYFQRVWGYDFPTAFYSAMPGGLQDMLVFGEEAGGNPRTLSLIHATRVLLIVAALPLMLRLIWDADLSNPPGAPAADMPLQQLGLMVLCAIAGWKIAQRIGLFGASILGPMIAATIASLTGLLHFRPPVEAIWLAQFFIGMTVGSKYSGITMTEVRRDLVAGAGFCMILFVISLAAVEFAVLLNLAPGREALLSFAPGGQAEMTVLALIVGADVAFVVAHHVFRIILVIVGAPIVSRLLNR